MNRATGLVRDHAEVVKRRVSFRAMRLGAPVLPLSIDLFPSAPPIADQGPYGRCVGEAYSRAANTRLAVAGTPVPFISSWCLYKLARCLDRGGASTPLTDSGTSPGSAISAMQNWGVVSDATWGQEDASSLTSEPTLTELEEASDFCFSGAYFLTSTGDQLVQDICTALAAGFPLCMSLAASGSQFNSYSGGVLGTLSGPIDHENACNAYTLASPGDWGSIIVKPDNSWGVGWGEEGRYRGNYDFVQQCQDWAVLDVVATGRER